MYFSCFLEKNVAGNAVELKQQKKDIQSSSVSYVFEKLPRERSARESAILSEAERVERAKER